MSGRLGLGEGLACRAERRYLAQMLFGRGMTARGWAIRLAICVVADLLDFTLGRALFALPWEEGPSTVLLTLMWGPVGLFNLAEILDFTEQFDAFVPMATLIGLFVGYQKGFLQGLWGAKPPAQDPPAPPKLPPA